MKHCCTCKKEKSFSDFTKNKNSKDGYAFRCKQCKSKEKTYPETKRKNHLARTYGITIEDYSKMFEVQKRCCAICGKHQFELDMSLVVDHDHETSQIRGLLCRNCNCRLGHYESGNKWYKENEIKISGYRKRIL